jgi:hypothetical protein
MMAILLTTAGCRSANPVLDTGPKPAQADATISGTVRGPEGTSPISNRAVEIINTETGLRQRVQTSNTGGFTFKVKPGKYRVELSLHDGEHLVKSPGEIDTSAGDVDVSADFVLSSSSVLRPRYHPPRSDDGLGAAIA